MTGQRHVSSDNNSEFLPWKKLFHRLQLEVYIGICFSRLRASSLLEIRARVAKPRSCSQRRHSRVYLHAGYTLPESVVYLQTQA